MKKIVIVVIGLLLSFSSFGKDDPKYPVSSIPEDMKTGMYAVIREKEVRCEINSVRSSSVFYRTVITILNSNAKSYASEVVGYDKFRTISNFKGTVYDADGEIIKRLKQSDIYDQSSSDGVSLYSDSRLKQADLSQTIYPYTVEFEYQIDQKMLYYLPDFYLYSDDEITIQKQSYSIIYPLELKPRYKLFNVQEPQFSKVRDKEVMQWSFENIKPNKFEGLAPDISKVVPNILAGPVDFEYDGYAGKMDTWENYGKWQSKLNEGRDVLPEGTKQRVRELTKDAKSTEEKVRILYEFLQSKTRYVSIQLGIGGLQPFEAKVVDQMGYGDCKALSNYMVSLLKEVGIKGYYTTIMAGDDAPEVNRSFPSHQGNHIIVAVPNLKDTLWLECTSQIKPFGYMGTFTDDRYALMITEAGGKLVKTITYTAEQNVQSRTADVVVELSGDAKATVKTSYQGLQYENGHLNFILNDQYDQQRKWIQDNTRIPSFDVNSFSMTNHKDKIPSAVVKADFTLKRFATVSGKRIFLTPNLMNKSTYVPEKLDLRKSSVKWPTSFTDLDTIRFHLPEGIYPEFLPEPVKIKSRFGEYEATYKLDQGNLVYTRKMIMRKSEFPADSYKELIDFFKGVNKADNSKMVFLSKT